MITEDQLEHLAIQWFQDTGKIAAQIPSPRPFASGDLHCATIPSGRGGKQAEREERGNLEHRTFNIERRSEEKRSLAEVVGTRRMNP